MIYVVCLGSAEKGMDVHEMPLWVGQLMYGVLGFFLDERWGQKKYGVTTTRY